MNPQNDQRDLHRTAPYRVAVHGLPHFCKKLALLLNGGDWDVPFRSPFHPAGWAARFFDLAQCDLAFSWTGRINPGLFLRTAKALDTKKVILLWCGSDVLFAAEELQAGKKDSWVTGRIHWAVSPWMAEEVRALGVDCEYVQTSFVSRMTPPPLPDEFSVLVYAPSLKKANLYGIDRVLEAAVRLPSIAFCLVGLSEGSIPGAPQNLKVVGHVNLDEFYRRSTVLWRPVRHDGLSFMVLESLARGRHVLYSYPHPGCSRVTSVEAAVREIERLRDLHSSHQLDLNQKGLQVIARDYDRDVVRTRLLQRWEQIILKPAVSPELRSAVQ